jgi:hypothetical protein
VKLKGEFGVGIAVAVAVDVFDAIIIIIIHLLRTTVCSTEWDRVIEMKRFRDCRKNRHTGRLETEWMNDGRNQYVSEQENDRAIGSLSGKCAKERVRLVS